MSENTPNPPFSSASQNQPQDTLLQSGAFDPPFTPGTLGRLNRFEIIRMLGEGGMGQVYLAREPLTDTTVAVKIMKPQMAADPQSVHRFLIEARHMYRLSHPRILRVLEVSDRKEGPYYVMPYIAGGSLLAQYKPGEPLPDERILSIAKQVAEALAHAHTHGLIHRDLKPANVLLDKDGNAYLTDFGLVRTVFNDSMVDATASHLEGTAPYMSPAVARGEAEDTRCDIYAFGAVLYELLTAQPPYTGRTPQMILDQILRGPPLPIRQVNPKANPALARIAERCMARELRDRYASMADVVADLTSAAQGKAPRGPRPQPSRLPKIAAMLVGALAVVGLIAFGISKLSDSNPVAGVADPGQQPSPPAATAEKMVTAFPAESPEPAATDPYQFSCTASNGAVAIARYTGEGGAVAIPATISGLPVTCIKNEAFLNNSNVTSVIIPNSVSSIGDHAFKNCGKLAKVTIPSSVTNIGGWAFEACPRLTSITIPAGVTSLGWDRFYQCSNLISILVDPLNPTYSSSADGVLFNKDKTVLLCYPAGKTGSYTIPASVNAIGDRSFLGCANLTGITIPNSVTYLGWNSFWDCSSLTNVTLPASVNDIKPNLFGLCGRLNSFTVDETNPNYSCADGVVFSKDKTKLVRYPSGKPGGYAIPANVTAIETCAFEGSPGLTGVTIPNGVKRIDDCTFKECTNLTSVAIPDSVTSIGMGAFFHCANLSSFTIPDSVTIIGRDAFLGTGLTTLKIPDSVTNLADSGAFADCTNLASVKIGNSVTKIGSWTFARCTKLSSITIPDSVTVIGRDAFNSSGLTAITIPDSVTNLADTGAFTTCTNLTRVTMGNGITKLGDWTFDACVSLTQVVFGAEVTSIGRGAFRGCRNLCGITFPDGLKVIGWDSFKSTALTAITIPDSVTDIDMWAFVNCTNLAHVMIGIGITNIARGAFESCSSLTGVYFKGNAPGGAADGSIFAGANNVTLYYRPGATGWGKEFGGRPTAVWEGAEPINLSSGEEEAIPSEIRLEAETAELHGNLKYSAGDKILCRWNSLDQFPTWTITLLKSGEYEVSFTYACEDGASGAEVAFHLGDQALTARVNGTSSWGKYITEKVGRVSLPAGKHEVKIQPTKKPEQWVMDLREVVLTRTSSATPKNAVSPVSTDGAFTCATNGLALTITRYTGPGGDVTIPGAIKGLPVTSIGNSAFQRASLTGVVIPVGVTNIGSRAFDSCGELTRVTIPSGVTRIGAAAFHSCKGLASATIPDSVTRMDWAAFYNTGITNVTIGRGVTKIENSAFDGCTNLMGIHVAEDNPSFSSVDGVLFNKEKTTLIQFPVGRVGQYTIPSGVTNIGLTAFSTRNGLTSVTVGRDVSNIDFHAFNYCQRLQGVYFLGNAPSLGKEVFQGAFNSTIYYLPGTTGWGGEFGGRPTVMWDPQVTNASLVGAGTGAVEDGKRIGPALQAGDPAPPLQQGRYVQGEPVTAFESGKVYVVEFWATWCGPCRAAIPRLNQLHEKFKDKGLVVIGQNVWERGTGVETTVTSFVTKMGTNMTYRVAMDDVEGNTGKMAETWMKAAGRNGIPSSFVINQAGQVAWIGHPSSLDDVVEKVLTGTFDIEQAKIVPTQRSSYAERRRQRSMESPEPAPEPKYTGAQLQKHLEAYQMQVIRAGLPPLPIPLTPEMDKQLVEEGLLPAP